MERDSFNCLVLAHLFHYTRIDGYVELEKYAPAVLDSMVNNCCFLSSLTINTTRFEINLPFQKYHRYHPLSYGGLFLSPDNSLLSLNFTYNLLNDQ